MSTILAGVRLLGLERVCCIEQRICKVDADTAAVAAPAAAVDSDVGPSSKVRKNCSLTSLYEMVVSIGV